MSGMLVKEWNGVQDCPIMSRYKADPIFEYKAEVGVLLPLLSIFISISWGLT